MSNLIFAMNTILPLLILISTGYLAKRLKMVSESVIKSVNNLVFRIFLPIMLLRNLMFADSGSVLQPGIFIFIGVGIFLLFGVLFLIIPRIYKDRRGIGVLIQGLGRSNYAIFGIPFVAMLFPDKDISLMSLLTIMIVPQLNTLSAVALEIYSGERVNIRKSLKGIILNPLVIASTIGFILMLINPPVPSFIKTSLNNLSQIASPLALFMLGASLEFKKIVQNKRTLILATITKLAVFPAIFVTLAILAGFREVELAIVLITFGAPTSVSSYTMAEQMGGDGDLAAEIVIFTSVFSIVSVFVSVYILKVLAFI